MREQLSAELDAELSALDGHCGPLVISTLRDILARVGCGEMDIGPSDDGAACVEFVDFPGALWLDVEPDGWPHTFYRLGEGLPEERYWSSAAEAVAYLAQRWQAALAREEAAHD